MKPKGMKINFSFILMVSCFLIVFSACEKPKLRSAQQAPAQPTQDDGSKDGKTKPSLTCENRWKEVLSMSPKDLETIYQESQTMDIQNETTVLSQSITEKQIKENTGAHLQWKKTVKVLAPEEGESISHHTMKKETFINLCSKGYQFIYTDRPSGIEPKNKQKGTVTLNGEDYEVDHELYYLSQSQNPQAKDYLELWIGSKAPYRGILFQSQRIYWKIVSGKTAKIKTSKELLSFSMGL